MGINDISEFDIQGDFLTAPLPPEFAKCLGVEQKPKLKLQAKKKIGFCSSPRLPPSMIEKV